MCAVAIFTLSNPLTKRRNSRKKEHVRMCRCVCASVCCYVCYIELKVFKMFDNGCLKSKNPFCSHLSLSIYLHLSSFLMDKRFLGWEIAKCEVQGMNGICWIREKTMRKTESNQRQAALNDSRRIQPDKTMHLWSNNKSLAIKKNAEREKLTMK